MPKLTDTQTIILSAAAQRPGNMAMPLPDGLHGAAAKKAVAAMISRGWLEEVEADLRRKDPLWRETGDGHGHHADRNRGRARSDRDRAGRGQHGAQSTQDQAGSPADAPIDRCPETRRRPGGTRNRPRSSRCFSGPRGPIARSSRRRMGATFSERHDLRGAQEEAGSRDHFSEGKRTRDGASNRVTRSHAAAGQADWGSAKSDQNGQVTAWSPYSTTDRPRCCRWAADSQPKANICTAGAWRQDSTIKSRSQRR